MDAASDLRDEIVRLQNRLAGLHRDMELLEGLQADTLQVVTCLAGEQTVAVPLERVDQVVLVPSLVPLSDAPAWMPGLLVLRGESLPVIDVAARLEGNPREVVSSDVVVIARSGERRVGLLMQDASGVWTVPRAEVHSVPEAVHYARFALGVIPVQDRWGILLSIHALCSSEDDS